MAEPPSDMLWQRLREELGMKPADLRAARRRVKKLARDLPAFDSVWIDAFLQTGCLTPWQARRLETDAASTLRFGDLRLLDELGHGAASTTWLARRRKRDPLLVLKHWRMSSANAAAAMERARSLQVQCAALAHPSLCLPREFQVDATGLLAVSPFVPGPALYDLLVRRGRFPADVVLAMACQLIDGLTALHTAGIIHGDIRRSHIRMTPQGVAVLVETGLRPLAPLDITIHAPLAPDAYDGLAPELIGIGRVPTAAADWYALGCVLWQLLAGRPPFPVADPLAKLAAHQTKSVDDVRERAPETPAVLAELVAGLTQADPSSRQTAVDAFRVQGGLQMRRSRARLAAFQHEFDGAAPHLRAPRPREWPRWPAALAAGCLGATLAALFADTGLRSQLLNIASSDVPITSELPSSYSADLVPLPPPSADGVIVLDQPGPYAAAAIRFPGTLTLRAAEGTCPEILIRDQPLRIAARRWRCEGVQIRCDRLFRAARLSPVLVETVAERIDWQRCRLALGEKRKRSSDDVDLIGVVWSVPATATAQLAVLRLTDSQFEGAGALWRVGGPATRIAVENSLHLASGPLLTIGVAQAQNLLQLELRQVTLRDSGPLVRMEAGDPTVSPRLAVTAEDCVLQSIHGHAVLEYYAAAMPAWSADALSWNGEGTLLAPHSPLAAWYNPRSGSHTDLGTEGIELDGLTIGQVQFAGLPTSDPANSVTISADVPRRSPHPPGIFADRMRLCGGTENLGAESLP